MKYLLIVASLLIAGIGCKSKVSNKKSDAATVETPAAYKDVDVTKARTMIAENQNLVILDVRTPEEVDEGIIPGAMVINLHDENFDAKIGILDKSKPYLVYCRKGGRSAEASEKMIKAGFKDVTNMQGGYTAWMEQ